MKLHFVVTGQFVVAVLGLTTGCVSEQSAPPEPGATLALHERALASLEVNGPSTPSYPEAALGADPNPSNPGLWLGTDVNPNSCFRDLNPALIATKQDKDNDWLFDDCEFKIASGFRPFLFSTNQCMGGEPTWAVKYFYYPPQNMRYVRIMYMLSYYHDCGYPAFGWTGGSGPGDGELIQLNVAFDGTSHWLFHSMSMSRHGNLPYYDWLNGAVTYGGQTPGKWRGFPNIWVSEGKHGNFLNHANCNWPDTCTSTTGARVAVDSSRNVGEVRHDESISPMNASNPKSCYTSYHADYDKKECYLEWQPFNGWHFGNGDHGGTYFSDLKLIYSKFYDEAGFGPGAPPPRISVSGPTSIAANQSYTWTADVNAAPPYSFQWSIDGQPAPETEQSISRSFGPNETHYVQIFVWAGDGTYGFVVVTVQTPNECGVGCEEWNDVQGSSSPVPKVTPRKVTVGGSKKGTQE